MVGVNFIGRLGNQIFQYVFLLYLKSENKNQTFFFPNPHHAQSLTKYFDLGFYHNITLSSKIYSAFTRYIPGLFKFKTITISGITSPKKPVVENNTMYSGYYQSDWYLKQLPYKPDIKIKKKYISEFQKMYGDIFKNNKTIAVHIRRTDYLNYHKRDISLPIQYFKSQLQAIDNLDSYKVFFLSDDINFVKTEFEIKPNFIFSENDQIIDFQIIQNADIAIISNSSFSWWAAYLSPKSNHVIAPKNWLGFRIGKLYPNGIMTDKFTWHDVPTNE